MSSSIANNSEASLELLESLKAQLRQPSSNQQFSVLDQLLAAREPGYQILQDFLLDVKQQKLALAAVAGRAIQQLHQVQDPQVETFLNQEFPMGLVPLPETCQADYSEIQTALVQEQFEHADRLTLQQMCALAGASAVQRKWLYFTEVNAFPITDLQTLDTLWRTYSKEKFGFSKQREIWLGVGQNWEKLWPKISWKKDNLWTRYPDGFIWSLEAPAGHLPLTNQLRGVRVMDALMNHPAWTSKSS